MFGIFILVQLPVLKQVPQNFTVGVPNVPLECACAQESVLHTTPWFRFPYPLQWGAPTFTWSSTLTMLAGAVSALVESVSPPASLVLVPSLASKHARSIVPVAYVVCQRVGAGRVTARLPPALALIWKRTCMFGLTI